MSVSTPKKGISAKIVEVKGIEDLEILGKDKINYNKTISPGANEIGFDYSYILADTQDRVPSVYIENGRVENLDVNDPISVNFDSNDYGLPTGLKNPELTTMKWHHGHNCLLYTSDAADE